MGGREKKKERKKLHEPSLFSPAALSPTYLCPLPLGRNSHDVLQNEINSSLTGIICKLWLLTRQNNLNDVTYNMNDVSRLNRNKPKDPITTVPKRDVFLVLPYLGLQSKQYRQSNLNLVSTSSKAVLT